MFDRATSSSPIEGAVDWLTGTLLGDVAIALCTIAVALVGFSMLTGRLPIRRGVFVILGVFLVLGGPVVANGLVELARPASRPVLPEAAYTEPELQPREPLPEATYNPYAGASMRRGHADNSN